MFDFQDYLIFPTHAVPAAGPWPSGAERLQVQSADGPLLHGIWLHAGAQPSETPTLILGFGGNGWNGQDMAEYLHELFPDEEVVVFHYRGYAPSKGSPSAEALMADAPLIYDRAVQQVKPARVIAVGFSIGSGIAAHLASERPVDGLILVTPFDSLKAVAQSMYPWLPLGPFFTHEIDAAGALQDSDVPVAIVVAERDEIVPSERTSTLKSQVRNVAFERTIAGAGHNDVYARSDFHDAMRKALNRLKV